MFSLCPPFREGGSLSQVWMGGGTHPRSGWGYPIPGLDGGYCIPGMDGGYPIVGLERYPGMGYSHIQVPGVDGGYPIPGMDRGTPYQVWRGVPWHGVLPHPGPRCGSGVEVRKGGGGTPTGTAWRVLAMRRAVCLLRSRRRTFFSSCKRSEGE